VSEPLGQTGPDALVPVAEVNRVPLELLVGIRRARATLLANTRQFANGYPANNALLWGARGMGKSSLVKAVHAQILEDGQNLKIVELQREDLPSVGRLLALLTEMCLSASCSTAMTCRLAMMISIISR